jgi:hypothetical protein
MFLMNNHNKNFRKKLQNQLKQQGSGNALTPAERTIIIIWGSIVLLFAVVVYFHL